MMSTVKAAKHKEAKETPLMQQYNTFKAQYPGALLLFRVGDFYETFGKDAITASQVLGIVLTKRSNGAAADMELAGFPHHSLENYLPKLVRAGHRVAICDQLEDPKLTKTIVKRGVTEVVTPGVSYNDNILQHTSNNYLACLYFGENQIGAAFLDISTGEFSLAQGSSEYIDKLLQSFRPSEVLFQKRQQKDFIAAFGDGFYTYCLDEWVFGSDYGQELLLKHFEVNSLKGFGVEHLEEGILAAGGCLHYVKDAKHDHLPHIASLGRIDEQQYAWLDRFTIRNLELVQGNYQGSKALVDILDDTSTPMGARLFRKWLLMPLKEKVLIEERLNNVEFFTKEPKAAESLRFELKQGGDLERLIAKVALQKANPRELVHLARSLRVVESVKKTLGAIKIPQSLQKIVSQLNACEGLIEKLEKELQSDAPAVLSKGSVIAAGVSEELDSLRKIAFGGKDYLLEIQKREIEHTGISSLKIAFNNVFGYYLEVTHAHKDKVPAEWIRKQTLVNAERYITPELKEYEDQILGAEEKIAVIESRLYYDLLLSIGSYIKAIQLNAQLLGQLDVLLSFAATAATHQYCKPEISTESIIQIEEGRHPVIEQCLPVGQDYIPNDICLDREQQILMITGPNMSGKSAILRQTALMVLMAQVGSFVPAKSAQIGIADKIFTRVGASDNLSGGESTFMVEMNETASILNNISDQSLILLDEIGRGTSTYDGISIAWAIAEYLHEHPKARARTLFATHYHELNEMAGDFERIKNYHVSIKEVGNKVIFLRKLVPGGSEHSFGIHVAKMAGMPEAVLKKANQVLAQLEQERGKTDVGVRNTLKKSQKQNQMQFQLFSLEDPVLIKIRDSLQNLEVNTLTPVEALLKLDEIQRLIRS